MIERSEKEDRERFEFYFSRLAKAQSSAEDNKKYLDIYIKDNNIDEYEIVDSRVLNYTPGNKYPKDSQMFLETVNPENPRIEIKGPISYGVYEIKIISYKEPIKLRLIRSFKKLFTGFGVKK